MRSARRATVVALSAVVSFSIADTLWAFPINSPNARTLFGGFTLVAPRFRLTRATTLLQNGERINNPGDLEATIFEEDLTVVYGATRDLTLGITVPAVQKRLRFLAPDGTHRELTNEGLGDLTLSGAYRFFRHDVPRGTTQFSLLGALKLPTARASQTDPNTPLFTGGNDLKLPQPLQLGSGSVDGILGVGGFQNFDRLSFYGDLQYKANSGANNFKAGNTFFYDLTADYVFFKERNFFLVLELNGMVTEKAEANGRKVTDSGGHIVFISPGLVYLPIPQLILETSIQVPILRNLNGTQLAPDFSVVVGARYLF